MPKNSETPSYIKETFGKKPKVMTSVIIIYCQETECTNKVSFSVGSKPEKGLIDPATRKYTCPKHVALMGLILDQPK